MRLPSRSTRIKPLIPHGDTRHGWLIPLFRWLAPALPINKKTMTYTTNITSYELRFSGTATVSAENEERAVEELRDLLIGNCDSFYITHANGR